MDKEELSKRKFDEIEKTVELEERMQPHSVSEILSMQIKMDKSNQQKVKPQRTGKKAKAEEILTLLEDETDILLFHDQYGEAYAALHGDGSKIYKIRSREFKRWVAMFVWQQLEQAISSETLSSILNVCDGKAMDEGEKYELHVRLAWHKDSILYDLGDGRAVRISKEGWEILNRPPIIFRRFAHQKTQAEPTRGGDIKRIFEFSNCSEKYRLLNLVWIVASFMPEIPHCIRNLWGEQGSCKSTEDRIAKELVDYSAVKEGFALPQKYEELVQILDHHYFCNFDNVSDMKHHQSDTLCRAVTGAAVSKRKLYTDSEDIIYNFKRVVSINGINIVGERGDFLERSIIIPLEKPQKYIRERTFWKRFAETKPAILGAIFDVLVQALNEYPQIEVKKNFRMSDFVAWGSAIAKVLGHTQEEFIEMYEQNMRRQNDEAIAASPLAEAITYLMTERDSWEGTPTETLRIFEEIAFQEKIDIHSKLFPKDVRWLWRRLNEVKTNLRVKGILIERERNSDRTIRITKTTDNEKNDGDVVNDDDSRSNAGDSPDNINKNDDRDDDDTEGGIVVSQLPL